MHPEIKHLQSSLSNLYERNRSPVGFIDESYREDSWTDEYPFYTVTATVVAADDIEYFRQDYVDAVGDWWHTTKMFEQKKHDDINDFISLVSEHKTEILVSVQVEIEENDIEHARRECLVQVAARLYDLGCNLIVYERREDNPSRNADSSLFDRARSAGFLPRNLRLFAGHPRAEHLLWGPDLTGWALRRHLALGDSKWIQPLLGQFEMIDASTGKALKTKGPQPAAAKGSGPDSFVGPMGEGKNRSSENSMARFGGIEKGLFQIFPNVRNPKHDPEALSLWLREQFPNRRKTK